MKIKENMEKILIFVIGILLGITVISMVYCAQAKKIKSERFNGKNGIKSQNLVMSPEKIHKRENEKIDFNAENKYEKNTKYKAKNVEEK